MPRKSKNISHVPELNAVMYALADEDSLQEHGNKDLAHIEAQYKAADAAFYAMLNQAENGGDLPKHTALKIEDAFVHGEVCAVDYGFYKGFHAGTRLILGMLASAQETPVKPPEGATNAKGKVTPV